MAGLTARMKELFNKYGKVAAVVHMSVSAVSIASFYVAIKSKVDVGPVLEKIGLITQREAEDVSEKVSQTEGFSGDSMESQEPKGYSSSRKESSPAAATAGGAFVLACLCNKALFPVRVPVTVALTPQIARFLARRKLYKSI